MLQDLVSSASGLPIYIVTKYGVKRRSRLMVEKKEGTSDLKISWRDQLGCEVSYIKSILKPVCVGNDQQITILFADFKLILELDNNDAAAAIEFYVYLSELLKKTQNAWNHERSHNIIKGFNQLSVPYQQVLSLRDSAFDATVKEEQLHQLCFYLRMKEAYMVTEKVNENFKKKLVGNAFKQWISYIKDDNFDRMNKDRHRWRLHATANQDIDLQAWYHALFYQEVYRLRGYFWYKDAVLPIYKQSYDLVDNALTPLEEAALAHVLCSPDTSYGDVAGQMFVVQAIIPPAQFALFQQLAAQGAHVVKYPRQGRPAKKLFRFSFVEGNIYLTWKGKFGNQGVGMSEVTSIVGGIQTEILKWSAQASKAEQYLSVICADRSVDLFFDSEEDRNNWRDLLKALVTKEQGKLVGVESVDPPAGCDEFEWLTLYAAIGRTNQVN